MSLESGVGAACCYGAKKVSGMIWAVWEWDGLSLGMGLAEFGTEMG